MVAERVNTEHGSNLILQSLWRGVTVAAGSTVTAGGYAGQDIITEPDGTWIVVGNGTQTKSTNNANAAAGSANLSPIGIKEPGMIGVMEPDLGS